jgi:hypothetical protein
MRTAVSWSALSDPARALAGLFQKSFWKFAQKKIPILKSKFSVLFPKNFGSLAQCRLREETPLSASFRPGATSGGLIRVRMR